jgi:hypothetical protein
VKEDELGSVEHRLVPGGLVLVEPETNGPRCKELRPLTALSYGSCCEGQGGPFGQQQMDDLMGGNPTRR